MLTRLFPDMTLVVVGLLGDDWWRRWDGSERQALTRLGNYG